MRSQEDGAGRGAGMGAAWLSPGPGSSGADRGKAVVLVSDLSLLGVEGGSDMAVREDLWELLEDADGEWLVLRPAVPTSSALKCC